MDSKIKHIDMNQFQCYHNNTGYCKFGDRCKFHHYFELCEKQVCRERACKFRHPKTCKFGEDCKFFKRNLCVYKHGDKKKDTNNDQKIKQL